MYFDILNRVAFSKSQKSSNETVLYTAHLFLDRTSSKQPHFYGWSAYRDQLATLPREMIIIEYLDFHFNNLHDARVCRFTGQLDAHGVV